MDAPVARCMLHAAPRSAAGQEEVERLCGAHRLRHLSTATTRPPASPVCADCHCSVGNAQPGPIRRGYRMMTMRKRLRRWPRRSSRRRQRRRRMRTRHATSTQQCTATSPCTCVVPMHHPSNSTCLGKVPCRCQRQQRCRSGATHRSCGTAHSHSLQVPHASPGSLFRYRFSSCYFPQEAMLVLCSNLFTPFPLP